MKKHIPTLLALLLLFILSGAILGILNNAGRQAQPKQEAESPPPPQTAVTTSPKKTVQGIPEEQYLFFNDILMPTLHKARTEYPIVSIRQKIDRLMGRIQSGEIRLTLQVHGFGSAFASANMQQRSPQMMHLFMPTIMRFFVEVNADQKALEDELIATLLHEEYHLDHHMLPEGAVANHERSESEAWWWTIEEVYLPMQRNGRLVVADNTVWQAIDAYRQANGSRQGATWTTFIKTVTAPAIERSAGRK